MSIPSPDIQTYGEFEYTTKDFARTRKLIYAHAGISLAAVKSNLVYGRLGKRLRALGQTRFCDYLDLVEADPLEREAFVNALTTNLTSFFREEHHFRALAAHILLRGRPPGLQVWCAAASTGEEPYSLAMTLADAYAALPPPVELIATDLDTNVLATAARGVYRLDRFQGVSKDQRRRYFQRGVGPHIGLARACPELRSMIDFRQVNLCAPNWAIPPALDVIFARNVMIYFDRATQLRIVEHFHEALAPDGLLVTGHSEILFFAGHLFEQVGKTIYRPVR